MSSVDGDPRPEVSAAGLADPVFAVDPTGVLRYANDTAAEVLEWDPVELIGSSVMELVHPDDVNLARAALATIVDKRVGDLITVSEATVKVIVDGQRLMSVGEGNGPVNALDNALRKDLGKYSAYIDDLRLVDFKVRILTSGTEAVTRVMIESVDSRGARWFTVGVSPNIVDASFQALMDSITFKLLRDGAPESRKAR